MVIYKAKENRIGGALLVSMVKKAIEIKKYKRGFK